MGKKVLSAALTVVVACFVPLIWYDRARMALSNAYKKWRGDGTFNLRY